MDFNNEITALDICTRLELARCDIKGVLDKYDEYFEQNPESRDAYYWIKDIYERLTDVEREIVIDNPEIRDYVEDDVK